MPPAPLLRLPAEMLRSVTDYLDLGDQIRLSMANRHLRFMLGNPTHADFIKAEASEFAISRQLYTCRGCVRFRSLPQFADDMRKGTRTRSGPDAQSRFCLECGVKRGWYSEGEKIAIYGMPAVLGRFCSDFTDQCDGKTSCGSQQLRWEPLRKGQISRYADGARPDDGWAYMSRSFTETRHAQEEYSLWLE